MNKVKKWYNESYRSSGFNAQRRYPNEELLRFLGVNFFDKNEKKERQKIKVLEVGCGSCANLWMVSKEGFDSYGLDLSHEALSLGEKMLDTWKVKASLQQGSFLDMPYEDETFDVVIDILSMYCVNHNEYIAGIKEVYRVLKNNGIFFSYTTGQDSTVFSNYHPSIKLDDHTLNGIFRKDSPYSGNHYPFHFWNKADYKKAITKVGFNVDYIESTKKTYCKGKEFVEYISTYSVK
jgi:ubiquinone/menaquinone biosynthesis C-methylase UbiE